MTDPQPTPSAYKVYATAPDGSETPIDARRIRIETAAGDELLIFLQNAGDGTLFIICPMKEQSEAQACKQFVPLAILPAGGNALYVRLLKPADTLGRGPSAAPSAD